MVAVPARFGTRTAACWPFAPNTATWVASTGTWVANTATWGANTRDTAKWLVGSHTEDVSWEILTAPEYWAARLVLQRTVALVYLIAFLVALNQFRALLGSHGLLPIPRFLRRTDWSSAPSVFRFHYSDNTFATVCWLGIAVSAALLLGATDHMPIWGSLVTWALPWGLYLSIVNVGQLWYSFGWESLLLETGFLAVFLGPARATATPVLVIWLFRWLLFRVEFGAGLIKIRGDQCWRDLTCLRYHHETQPMPGPLSWYFHQGPRWIHKCEVLANHFTQLVVPFALFTPQPVASVAAAIVIITQGWLVVSGNFSWLNALTLVLAFAAVADTFLRWIPGLTPPEHPLVAPTWYMALVIALTVGVAVLSYWPVRNMVGRGQIMNTSFNQLHLVNTYGAFGHITKARDEVVIEATSRREISDDTVWYEYEFKGKPGDPYRRPPQIAPYHLRLDWLMWFVALSPAYGRSWLARLAAKLLAADRTTLKLFRDDPFHGEPPAVLRARLYRYRYTTRQERRDTGAWWHREPLGLLLRECTLAEDGTIVPVPD